jgi:hypothetical protein
LKREPQDIFELLDEPENFNRPIYLATFAPYRWTYIAGYRELVDRYILEHGEHFDRTTVREILRGWRKPAMKAVPTSWKDVITADQSYWSSLNPDQINKACDGLPTRFDRACQIVKALDLAFRHSHSRELQNLNVYALVVFQPAIYVFDGLGIEAEHWIARGDKKEARQKLVGELCGGEPTLKEKACSFLKLVAKGAPITRATAVLIQDHARLGGHTLPLKVLEMRARITGPCPLEAPFVRIAKDKEETVANAGAAQAAEQSATSGTRK